MFLISSYISILLSWVTFCFFLSLIERSVNFTASTQLREENISQSYSLEEYTVVLFVIPSKIVLLNPFDRENDNSQHFNLKNIYNEKIAKSITVIIFKRGMFINLFFEWQIFRIKYSLIFLIIIEVIPIDWYPKNIILSFEDRLQSD